MASSIKPQPRTFAIEQSATVYALGSFGYKRIEVRSLSIEVGKYAQWPDAIFVTFTEKGKRKARAFVETFKPGAIVLAGHGHPEPIDIMRPEKRTESGLTVSHARWTAFSPEWVREFESMIDPYLAERSGVVFADYRGFDCSGGERAEELRAGAMLRAGDRVVTPIGTGVVTHRRMAPPDFSKVEAFGVKLDANEHAGATFPAMDVRWAGVS